MTPLAHRIVKELTLPLKDRTFNDPVGLLKKMSDIHCFDTTAVDEVVWELAEEMRKDTRKIGRLAFLPAPRTWIESSHPELPGRNGVLLEEFEHPKFGPCARSFLASDALLHEDDEFSSGAGTAVIPLIGSDFVGKSFAIDETFRDNIDKFPEEKGMREDLVALSMSLLYASLALINTPRIVGRVTHLPHRGLQKALIAKRQLVGNWPLHAWHEIKLSITPPGAQPGEIEEGHLTGRRALHFVRQHLRIRLGRLELVSAHWRGDAQLGIKRARYAVTH